MPEPIDHPLWDLMLSTHGCDPGCGCDADFAIEPTLIRAWIGEFGEDFGLTALRQIDELLGCGRAIEEAVADQRNQRFRRPETVTNWLTRWRIAIVTALGDRAAAK
jgi:hypothetical protein